MDVFISYRRNGAESLAQLLYTRLTTDGYQVFLDVESLRSGKFNEALYRQIDECTDFLLLLPEHGLDRCASPTDWVRLEIERAILKEKNIIPVMMRNFSFPAELPESMAELRRYNGVKADMEYFDAVYEKLKKMLHSGTEAKPKAPGDQAAEELLAYLQSMYKATAAFREATKSEDVDRINSSSSVLCELAGKIFYFGELNKFIAPGPAAAASQVVERFNTFLDAFRNWAADPSSEQDVVQAFAALVDELVNTISELRRNVPEKELREECLSILRRMYKGTAQFREATKSEDAYRINSSSSDLAGIAGELFYFGELNRILAPVPAAAASQVVERFNTFLDAFKAWAADPSLQQDVVQTFAALVDEIVKVISELQA